MAKAANVATHTDAGLAANTAYSYKVRAFNSGFTSAWTNCVSAITGKAGTPEAAAALKAVSVSADKINLSWKDNSTDEKSFKIFRKAGAGAWTLLKTTVADKTGFSDATATGNTTATSYSYNIKACNALGCSPNSAVATAPFMPVDFTATAGTSGINLAWTDPSDNESGFEIQRKDGDCASGNAWGLFETAAANMKTWRDTGVSSGAMYAYKVRAFKKSPAAPYAFGYSMFTECREAAAQ